MVTAAYRGAFCEGLGNWSVGFGGGFSALHHIKNRHDADSNQRTRVVRDALVLVYFLCALIYACIHISRGCVSAYFLLI